MIEMTEKKKAETAKVGELWELPSDPAEVTRPDGSVVTVTGGLLALDEPGKFECDGQTVTAK